MSSSVSADSRIDRPTPDAACTVGAYLAEGLRQAGVTHVFGFPGGGSNLDLIEELRRVGLPWVLTRSELGAAYMATATAETRGALAAVVVGNGPGLASVVNGVANAQLDRVPMIVVSDRFTDEEARTTGHQILDQRTLLRPLVKGSWTLGDRDPAETIAQAALAAFTPPRGPVHIDVPRDLLTRPVVDAGSTVHVGGERMAAEIHVEEIAATLADATRPALLLGLEGNGSVDPDDVERLAGALRAPVLTTYKAKGLIDERSPWYAGVLTGGAIEAPLLERADCILAVGLDPVELLSRRWPFEAPLLSLRSCDVGDDYLRPARAAVGELGAAVGALAECFESARCASSWSPDEIAALHARLLDRLRVGDGARLRGWSAVETVAALAPDDAIVTVDAGAHMFPATAFWRASAPRRFLISNGLATMGFAIPAAIGAALANPGLPVVALTGDGGATYHFAELETAVRSGARVMVVVLDDASLSLIRIKQEAKGQTSDPLDFGDVDFATLARSFGLAGYVASTVDDLHGALTRAWAESGSAVIDARIAGDEYAETLVRVRG